MSIQEKIAAARSGGSPPKPSSPPADSTEVVGESETKVEVKAKPAPKKKEQEVEKTPEPVGRPTPLLPILLTGWIGFAVIVGLVYVFFGPTLLELATKPTIERPTSSAESQP